MKKKIFLIPFAVVSLSILSGLVSCGGSTETSQGPDSSQTVEEKIKITAEGGKTSITIGDSLQLTASVEGVSWSIKDEGIISIDQNGLVKALGAGKTTVTAHKDGYQDGTLSITVKEEKIVVTAANNQNSVVIGGTIQLTASIEGVAWTSSDLSVATVSTSGLVTALKAGDVTITASKQGFANGTIAIKVTRPAPTATLHWEDADHYSANGWWSTSSMGSERGPGATPIYSKESASDGTCVAYFDAGDKETLTFTSSEATKAELVLTMGNYSAFEDLGTVEKAVFNDKEISMAGKSYSPGDNAGNYVFQEVSLGEVDVKKGVNKLAIEFLGSAPYLDDLVIYASNSVSITVNKAPEKATIEVESATLEVETEGQVQIKAKTEGCSYICSNTAVATVSDTGVVTGVAKGTATVTVMKEGMISTRVAITVKEKQVAGEIRVEAETGVASGGEIAFRTPSANTAASGAITGVWPADATLTIEFETTAAGKMMLSMVARAGTPESAYSYSEVDLENGVEFKFNGTKLNLTGTIESSVTKLTEIALGEVNVVSGKNTISIKAITVAPTLDFFKLTPVA
ncbi:MAG: Ig-like domain-containing protein [Bacilli bacterium]|nr:Ig-like domain-containing protein [Bacilli bacterium]